MSGSVTVSFARRPINSGNVYHHEWDIREDESLYADIPENGGILAYQILKGIQLPLDRAAGSLMTPAARLANDQLVLHLYTWSYMPFIFAYVYYYIFFIILFSFLLVTG